MYRCILVPVDGSAFGEHAIPLAVAIARRSGATLHLAHVHEAVIVPTGIEALPLPAAWSSGTDRELEQSYLDGLVQRISRGSGVRVDATLLDGPVAPALERYALGCGASLVVMSTHAHAGLARLWHQGVADRITRDLPMPVLVVRPEDAEEEPDLVREWEIRHILVPLDGSAHAEAMLEHAVELGRGFDARYTLLRIVRPHASVGDTFLQDGHTTHHRLVQEQTAARQYLTTLAERMRAPGLEVHVHVAIADDPAEAIVQYVRAARGEEGRVDLIALETHPHRALSRFLGAHTADAVLRRSPAPVLLFEPPVPVVPAPAATSTLSAPASSPPA